MPPIYIPPHFRIHGDLKALEDYVHGYARYFDRSSPLTIGEVCKEKRIIVTGEPGIGKTVLLQKIAERKKSDGGSTLSFRFKDRNLPLHLRQFCAQPSIQPKSVILDGLDEVRGADFNEIIK